jgi:hypothetical protein
MTKIDYDFGNKRHWRRIIGRTFRSFLGTMHDKNILVMPSRGSAEIDSLLRYGAKEYRIHAVDSNKAIVAWAKRRHPLIKTYGHWLSHLDYQNLKLEEEPLHAASLDFTGCLSGVTLYELQTFIYQTLPAHSQPFLLAVNLQKGREQVEITAMMAHTVKIEKHLSSALPEDLRARVALLGEVLSIPVQCDTKRGNIVHVVQPQILRWGEYKSSGRHGVKMWWSIWVMKRQDQPPRGCERHGHELCLLAETSLAYRQLIKAGEIGKDGEALG